MRGSRFRPQSRPRALRAYHVAADASRGEPGKEAQPKIRQEQANAAIADEQQDVMPVTQKTISAHE
jgi:hypothetical protein